MQSIPTTVRNRKLTPNPTQPEKTMKAILHLAVAFLFSTLTAGAASPTWIGGSGTWNDTTTANWDTGAVPANGDIVGIKSTNATLNIGYTATTLTYNHLTNTGGTRLITLNLYNPGTGALTFTLDGTDSLPVQNHAYVGGALAGGPTTLNIWDSAYLTCGNGGNKLWVGGHAAYGATLNQSGGTVYSVYGANIEAKGTYNLSATGTYESLRSLTVNAGGTWNQTSGTATHNYGVSVSGTGATLNLSGGTFYPQGDITVGAGATVNYTGGQFRMSTGEVPIPKLLLTGIGATWNMQGTTLTVNRAGTPGVQSVVTAVGSTVQGYGTIQDHYWPSRPDFNGTFDNSGRVTANGYGTDRTLDLSRIFYVANTTSNATDNGWFATNHGRLALPNASVTSAAASYNWGEAAADTTIDLVNSARLTFAGLGTTGTGTLTGALLAVDRTDVPAFAVAGMSRAELFSVHDLSLAGITFTDFDLAIRYDDLAAAGFEDVLQIFHYTGGAWVALDSTVDLLNKRITATDIGSFSLFGVGYAIPEPASALLLGLAGLLSRRRRR